MSSPHASPCARRGPCCVGLRVSFYWGEGDDAPGGWVPVQFTRPIVPCLRVMCGNVVSRPRRVALEGEVGRALRRTIYDRRPSPCREFEGHGKNREPNSRCNQRRVAARLPALPDPPGRTFRPTADVQSGTPA